MIDVEMAFRKRKQMTILSLFTVFMFLTVWLFGVTVLIWTDSNDNQVEAELVQFAEYNGIYYGVFNFSEYSEYLNFQLTYKQFDQLRYNQNKVWLLSRDVNPFLLDSGHQLPMFSDKVKYPDWYRTVRPLVEYCRPLLFYLFLQFIVIMVFIMIDYPADVGGGYEIHRNLQRNLKRNREDKS